MRSAAVPPRTVSVAGRLPRPRFAQPATHQVLRPCTIALPLPPQLRSQFVPDPAIEFFQHALHFGELEVRDLSSQYGVELLDDLLQTSSACAAQRRADFLRKTFDAGLRDLQLRFPVPRHAVAQKLFHGRATALFAALTFSFSLRSRNAATVVIVRSPLRLHPT